MSPSSVSIKELNRVAHYVSQFGSPYIVPARTNLCPPASYGTSVAPKPRSSPRPPQIHNELNRLASFVTQFDSVYLEVRIPATCPDFLIARKNVSETEKQNLSHLKELNRLARLVELSHCPMTPVYPCYTPLAYQVHDYNYGKGLTSPVASKLRDHLKLSASNNFNDAFPHSDKPRRISRHLGSSRYDQEQFNRLLITKLDQARRFFKLNHTPSCYPRLITSWITSLLSASAKSKKPTTVQKKSASSRVSEQKTRNNIDFVTSTDSPKESRASTPAPTTLVAVTTPAPEEMAPSLSPPPAASIEPDSGLQARELAHRLSLTAAALRYVCISPDPSSSHHETVRRLVSQDIVLAPLITESFRIILSSLNDLGTELPLMTEIYTPQNSLSPSTRISVDSLVLDFIRHRYAVFQH